jgi:hypothetical protein
MMMSKPKPEDEEVSPPAFATLPPPSKVGTVEDLQNRLALLGGEENKKSAPVMQPPVVDPTSAATTAAAAAAAPAAVKGGKNALLVSTLLFATIKGHYNCLYLSWI